MPCVCAAHLKGKELTNFNKSAAVDPLLPCPCVCPFDVVHPTEHSGRMTMITNSVNAKCIQY